MNQNPTPAFWDASALVPLCLQQPSSDAARLLLQQYGIVVWWATPAEMRSAFERLLRTGNLELTGYNTAGKRLKQLRREWREVQPTVAVRTQAEDLLMAYPLKAADALQLAAAWVWSSGACRERTFISADAQLLHAARQLGFQSIDLNP